MLSDQQIRAAWLKANGRADTDVIRAVGVHKTNFYRWMKKPEFLKAIADAEVKIAADNPVTAEEAEADLRSARDDDRRVLGIQRELTGELSEFALDMIRHIRAEGVEAFSVRAFPGFCKLFFESVAALQATTDRLVGIEALIEDVEQIEQTLQIKGDELAERRSAKGDGSSTA